MPRYRRESGYRTEYKGRKDLPLPIHMLVTSTWAPVLWSSESPVTTCLTPAVEYVRVRGTWSTMRRRLTHSERVGQRNRTTARVS